MIKTSEYRFSTPSLAQQLSRILLAFFVTVLPPAAKMTPQSRDWVSIIFIPSSFREFSSTTAQTQARAAKLGFARDFVGAVFLQPPRL